MAELSGIWIQRYVREGPENAPYRHLARRFPLLDQGADQLEERQPSGEARLVAEDKISERTPRQRRGPVAEDPALRDVVVDDGARIGV